MARSIVSLALAITLVAASSGAVGVIARLSIRAITDAPIVGLEDIPGRWVGPAEDLSPSRARLRRSRQGEEQDSYHIAVTPERWLRVAHRHSQSAVLIITDVGDDSDEIRRRRVDAVVAADELIMLLREDSNSQWVSTYRRVTIPFESIPFAASAPSGFVVTFGTAGTILTFLLGMIAIGAVAHVVRWCLWVRRLGRLEPRHSRDTRAAPHVLGSGSTGWTLYGRRLPPLPGYRENPMFIAEIAVAGSVGESRWRIVRRLVDPLLVLSVIWTVAVCSVWATVPA